MSRRNVVLAALLVAAVAVFAPSQSAAGVTSVARVAIAGSTGVWQAMGLGTYNDGNCPKAAQRVHPPCQHYTDNTKFNLVDTRPTNYQGGTDITDTADLWIVWDTPTLGTRNVWLYIKPDTIIANKCYFAKPTCIVYTPSGYDWTILGQLITPWGSDTQPPTDVTALFGAGIKINTLMSELRPEDALFEQCRVNSALGNGTETGSSGLGDGLDGLGYNANNPSGTCPKYVPGGTAAQLAKLVGSPILSGITDGAGNYSTAYSNVAAFNITGNDPFTNLPVPSPTVYNIGIFPIFFAFSNRTGAFAGVSDATDDQLQEVFSGANCNTNVFAGGGNNPINAWLREPLSGTMTTTELNTFRRELETTPVWKVVGVSQETGVNAARLSLQPCALGGGTRTRGIGTGEVINGAKVNGAGPFGGVLQSGEGPFPNDGIGYAFWSFGNFSKLAGSTTFSYLSLDGEDPLGIPGYSPGGQIPPLTYPASEASLWPPVKGKLNSYPNVRAGKYTVWTNVRMESTVGVDVADLTKTLYQSVVNFAPDFIPAESTKDSSGNVDPGEEIWHTRFQQRDADGNALGRAPINGTFTSFATGCNPKNPDTDKGGEAGGCTISTIKGGSCITAGFDKNKIQTAVTESGGHSVSTCTTSRN